ncbi:MAG TPA: hypothetical protein VLE19_09900, partial [Pyrinomonadaceae bacterium]|nr:hypothetical protein [Pyrinomonadaceae bacterium]
MSRLHFAFQILTFYAKLVQIAGLYASVYFAGALLSDQTNYNPAKMNNPFTRHFAISRSLLIFALAVSISAQAPKKVQSLPKLLSVKEQQTVREAWLQKRLDTLLLPMMRQQKIDMWIVVNEEFHP